MEATTTRAQSGWAGRHPDRLERDLESLRPLGQRYVRAHFGPGLSAHDAEDVVQEVIAKLFFRIERGEESRNLNALFFTSVHNASVDLLRHRRRRPEAPLEAAPDEPSAVPEPIESALASDTGALVRDVLTRIRPRYREALALRFGVGLNTVEIAAHKRISVTAAKKLVNRAAHETASELARLGGGEHCPDAQRLIRAGSVSRALADGSASADLDQLDRHLAHCGACKSFLSQLRGLHELAGTALLTGSAADSVSHNAGLVHHLIDRAAPLADAAHAAADRARLAAYRAADHLNAAEAPSAGAITGTAKQITAICATGAAAATCLATGVVGPGVEGINAETPDPEQSAEVQAVSDPPSFTTTTTPGEPPAPQPQPPEPPMPDPTPEKPAEQINQEIGIEATASASSAPSPTSTEFGGAGGGSSGGGGGSGGGGFGFER